MSVADFENVILPLYERSQKMLQHLDTIAVRVEIDGRWQSKYLAELPAPLAIAEAFRLLLQVERPPAEREGET
jgi:hypothetical protein